MALWSRFSDLTDQTTHSFYLKLCIEKVTNAGYCVGNETSGLMNCSKCRCIVHSAGDEDCRQRM